MEFAINTYTPAPDKPARVKRQKCGPGTMQPRRSITGPLLYPLLLEASAFEDDPEWKTLMQKAAHGEFVNKSIRYDGKAMYKSGPTTIVEQMPRDPAQLARRFVLFHAKHEGISTERDILSKDRMRESIVDKNVELSWDICHKTMKTSRLVDFAKRNTKTLAEADDLLAVLYTANASKLLNKDSVSMINNSIVDISVIAYNEKSNQWYIRS